MSQEATDSKVEREVPRRRVALLTGVTGQDGSYLSEFLLEKNYEVHGIIRRSSSFNTGRIDHIYNAHREDRHLLEPNWSTLYQDRITNATTPRFFLHYGDLTDSSNICSLLNRIQPDEIYNLGAQSHVKVSFEMAEYTADVDAVGTLRLLDGIRTCNLEKKCKFYQASTSELYGKVQEIPQTERTPFYPRSPYAVAKQYAYWIVVNYREAYNIFASNGILFNHESPRRGPTFVTRKITQAVARISSGLQKDLELGNLDAKRDWGHAKDYVEAMWLMLQQEKPDDFVVASGETHSVREFVEKAFARVGLPITWEGSGVDEVGKGPDGRVLVKVNPQYFRPTEVDLLHGDPTKARRELGWTLRVHFDDLINEMVDADVVMVRNGLQDHTRDHTV
eukprot:TRINITY_DN997_c0_g1_i3.p1 TRINITY_DN997_c0_g1~~TRINITY_DN997_c0_g1_i3.p1  ORF type:complete len:392 (-),score=126.41 TRINITY_DN997_c0_g1_i3:56-1231(-)